MKIGKNTSGLSVIDINIEIGYSNCSVLVFELPTCLDTRNINFLVCCRWLAVAESVPAQTFIAEIAIFSPGLLIRLYTRLCGCIWSSLRVHGVRNVMSGP